jgi:hypothetical protein
MRDVEIDFNACLRQAGMTAHDYLLRAYAILKNDYNDHDWGIKDAIELAKIMAQDYHSSIMAIKMQEIRDAIRDQPSCE